MVFSFLSKVKMTINLVICVPTSRYFQIPSFVLAINKPKYVCIALVRIANSIEVVSYITEISLIIFT